MIGKKYIAGVAVGTVALRFAREGKRKWKLMLLIGSISSICNNNRSTKFVPFYLSVKKHLSCGPCPDFSFDPDG